MAKDDDRPGKDKGDGPEGGPDIKKVLEALSTLGVTLPDDTTMDNLTDRLIGAAAARGGMPGDEGGAATAGNAEPTPVPAEGAVAMSLQKKAAALEKRLVDGERKAMEARVHALARKGVITKPHSQQLLRELSTVRLSLDESGNVQGGTLAAQLSALEQVPGRLSLGGDQKPEEAPRPAWMTGQGPQTPREVDEAVKDWDVAAGRR